MTDIHESNEPVEEQPQTAPCYECASGVMRLRFITYFTWLNEELVTVPNFPAWICDVCGRREYDEKAISWLTMLLNPEAGRSTHRKRLPPPARPRPVSRPPTPDQS
ncbi:MAG: YgiT-type zinc finger protein [Chloroflexota bacterium]